MSPIRMARIETGLRAVIAFTEAFNRHDVPAMMKLMTDDCVFEDTNPAPDGAVYKGKQVVTRFWEDFFRESPNAKIKIEEIFGLGMRCVMHWRYDWEDCQGNMGYVRGVDVYKIKEGLICEKLSYVKG